MKYIIAILSILFFFSCSDQDYIYHSKEQISNNGWAYENSLDYNFDITDTSKLYSLVLDVNHTTDYPYQNIIFNISTTFPSGKKLEQKLPSDLADQSGKWYGKCSGKSCTASINLQARALFNELGKHRIQIAQYSRDSLLMGVKSASLKLSEYKAAE